MAKKKAAWLSMVPPALVSKLSLDELRAFKSTHAFLTAPIPGPEGLAYHVRGFRYLLFFAAACRAEKTHPALNRCWDELDELFLADPRFEDGVFMQSWMLFDFPFGPKGETMLDYFEQFLAGSEGAERLRYFIAQARKSRLGLYQDVMRTKTVAKFRELVTGDVVSAVPSVESYGKGEILLTRMMEYHDQVFVFGDPKGFPASAKAQIEDMVLDKMLYFFEATDIHPYAKFMKLAGPYWMSCVTTNQDAPILDPDHYRSYV